MKKAEGHHDSVWRALADATRREMLDVLAERPQTTGELVEWFGVLCRTNVMKHLDVLVEANLVIVRRQGRVRWNHINPVPIQRVCDRWVSRHVRSIASAMSRLKDHVEEQNVEGDAAVGRKRRSTTKSKAKGKK